MGCAALVCASAYAQSLFTAAANPAFDAGAGPYDVKAADLNHDGNLDLVFADYGSGRATVLLGDGKGGFTPAPGSPFGPGLETVCVAVGDFNGDGHPDLALLNSLSGPQTIGQGTVTILLGDGKGGFSYYAPGDSLTGNVPGSIAIADFNHDGKPDLAIGTAGGFTILLGKGDGSFNFFRTTLAGDAVSIIAADFDGDHNPDLAFTTSAGVSVALGDGHGNFATPITTPGQYRAIAAADLNGDGKPRPRHAAIGARRIRVSRSFRRSRP